MSFMLLQFAAAAAAAAIAIATLAATAAAAKAYAEISPLVAASVLPLVLASMDLMANAAIVQCG